VARARARLNQSFITVRRGFESCCVADLSKLQSTYCPASGIPHAPLPATEFYFPYHTVIMVKFLPVAALALAAAPATVLAAKDKEDAGINRADTAACVSQGNEACGDGK